MKGTPVEPGFVQAYRLFAVTCIVFWIVVGPILVVVTIAGNPQLTPEQAVATPLVQSLSLPSVAPAVALDFLLLLLLMLPQAPRRLGARFVPLTLLIGLVPLLIGAYWWPSPNPLQTPFAMFFFVMLILIAWQYRYRYVFTFVLALSLYEAWLIPWPAGVPWTAPAGWLILQAAMMLLVGYVTATFVSVQREQRSALAEAYEQQARAHRRLQRYAATAEELATSRERNRLARELHDTLAHSLSAVAVQLEAALSLWPAPPREAGREAARSMVEQAGDTARTGLTEARRALQALRASPLQDLGLALAVRELAETAAQRSGAALELHVPDGVGDGLPLQLEQGVYRIAQETLENVVRHAEAGHIAVRLEQQEGQLSLTVEDDGQGIDLPALTGQARTPLGGLPSSADADPWPDRLGILGMQERAALVGGQLGIDSRPGGGTRVTLTVPL